MEIVFPEIPKTKTNFSINTTIIDKWLVKVRTTHEKDDDSIPSAQQILSSLENHELIWSYERKKLKDLIDTGDFTNKKSDAYFLSSLVQLIAVTHYLLERCCFTIIQPINEDWAFDMFQSLNASGTPLTAIETFKPLVVNNTEFNKEKYETSISKKSFTKVEELFKDSNNAASKSKLTNEFLTSLAIVLDGSKLESHFSSQRKYLDKIYTQELKQYKDQCEVVNFIGNYADFYKNVWIDYKGSNNLPIDRISSNSEADLISLLILFLKKSNHRMTVTLLGCFYNDVINGKSNSIANFVEVVKAISAFYILWRACDSNAGIDNYYRNFFKGKDDELKPHNWLTQRGSLNVGEVKNYLKQSLFTDKKISTKKDWLNKAKSYLKYQDSSVVCRIALLISAHDTIVDDKYVGLMKAGKNNSSPCLNLQKWNSSDIKDIEHIAPQDKSSNWDATLYDNLDLYDTIGNLTLLPSEINISASNKGWKEKYLYYQHLGAKDPQKAQELSFKAKESGIKLNDTTIELLQNCNYNEHILPILAVGEENKWDAALVQKRSERILELTWDKVITWLS